MKLRSLRVCLVLCTLGAGGLALAAPADAAVVFVRCGQTIRQNTTLAGPVSNCRNNGIVIGANNITLDLNGFTVSGRPEPGDGAGVLIVGRSGVTVRNGRVRQFDGGVVIQNSDNNTVTNIVAEDNVGQSLDHPPSPGTLYGDGIALLGSSNNKILSNTAQRNAPFSGIGIYRRPDPDHPSFTEAPTGNNLVEGNSVLDNTGCRLSGFCDNDGIRVEPAVDPGNVIRSNIVTGNGLDGISLFGLVHGVFVSDNEVSLNGFNGAVDGDGIRVFGYGNYIFDNASSGNAAAGISVGRRTGFTLGSFPLPNGRNNQIVNNFAVGNHFVDLWDGNVNCDANRWYGNQYHTANQPCTTVGGTQI